MNLRSHKHILLSSLTGLDHRVWRIASTLSQFLECTAARDRKRTCASNELCFAALRDSLEREAGGFLVDVDGPTWVACFFDQAVSVLPWSTRPSKGYPNSALEVLTERGGCGVSVSSIEVL